MTSKINFAEEPAGTVYSIEETVNWAEGSSVVGLVYKCNDLSMAREELDRLIDLESLSGSQRFWSGFKIKTSRY